MKTRKKIVLVDDDHDTLDLMEIFLYKKFDIVTAMNGFEAIAKVETEKPDLVLTDIKMPVMDGIRFFNTLRKNPAHKDIPIIAVTSFIKDHSLKSLIAMGFNGVVTKPPEAKAVLAAIDDILKPESGTKKQSKSKRE